MEKRRESIDGGGVQLGAFLAELGAAAGAIGRTPGRRTAREWARNTTRKHRQDVEARRKCAARATFKKLYQHPGWPTGGHRCVTAKMQRGY